ncbi:hypothetical protein [Clostridium oceanicum]|uniref:Uncharacterized protein n=1 Tax=Clostridium oceanicum TaxID=1543 RepID=A0ABP3UKZ6_9CLOT
MKTSNILERVVFSMFGAFFLVVIGLLLMFIPILSIVDGFKIIKTGYTVEIEYLSVVIAILFFVYVSLRFRIFRKLYKVFPFLFETVKFLVITNIFISLGVEFLNWSYVTLNSSSHKVGILVFIISLILWRVVISVYYSKKPIVNFMPKEEKIRDYSEKVC